MHSKCKAECCGIVPIPKEIYKRNKDKIIRVADETIDVAEGDCYIPITKCAHCVFLNYDSICNIYEDRPDVCRKFGDESHPMLFCHYLDKDGKERSRQNRRFVERQTAKHISKLRVIK
jgi:Fe-S-cluster containining protein